MPRANVEESSDVPSLLVRSDPTPPARILRNAAASVGIHLLLALFLYYLPDVEVPTRAPVILADVRRSVQIVAPRFTDLTQKDPNKGKISHSLDVRSAEAAPLPQTPRTSPSAKAPVPAAPPAPAPAPITVPTSTPAPVVIEVPKPAEVATAIIPGPPTNGAQLPPPPSKPPAEKPKLAFESVTAATIRAQTASPSIAAPPKTSVENLARTATRQGSGTRGVVVGDDIDQFPTPASPGQIPLPGRNGSNLQLLSDPAGVDFKPYLVQVLTAVRRNWMSVIPESARYGRRGQVLIQFIIDRDGKVPKLVIASASGTDAFDRAAVAGVSMSHPFPPLPPGYKGDEIRLQLAFSYNMAR